MANQAELQNSIHACIDELNQQLPESGKLTKSADTILVGEGGVLDSLGLITLLVNIEEALNTTSNISAPLLDELMAEHNGEHPFHTIATLLAWLHTRSAISQIG